jgi:hypothetical protein
VRISIRGATEEPLKKQMEKLSDSLLKKLDRDAVRRSIEPWWEAYTIRLPVGNTESYLHFTPRQVGLSDVAYTADGVRFSLGLLVESQAALSATSPFANTPLPDLTHLGDHANRLRVDVPLVVDYDEMAACASKVLEKQTFSMPTKAGPVQISLRQVEIYPTDGAHRFRLSC